MKFKLILITLLAVACGKEGETVKSSSSTLKIVNGKEVGQDDPAIKSTVGIFRKGDTNRPTCSGTLVGPNHIVTAAHCLDKEPLKIGFGQKANETTFKVASYMKHPDYVSYPDIGLIVFDGMIDPKKHKIVDIRPPIKGEKILISGFGITSSSKRDHGVLRITQTKVSRINKKTLQFYSVPDRKGPCNGDSGGPVFVKEGEALVLIGATSGGLDCSLGGAIYTNVSEFENWMTEAFDKLGSPWK